MMHIKHNLGVLSFLKAYSGGNQNYIPAFCLMGVLPSTLRLIACLLCFERVKSDKHGSAAFGLYYYRP